MQIKDQSEKQVPANPAMSPLQLILAWLLVISGTFLRFYHLLRIDIAHEPFRLGGLFVAFSEQILNNGFRLPVSIPFYSDGGLPFAYPPLAFYLEAFLLKIFPGREILLANLLPPFISIITLWVAALFLKSIFRGQPWHFIAALFACAFLTSMYSNQIEAAGIAEATGSLALIAFFAGARAFRDRPGWKNALLEGAGLGLCILSSPGSALGGPVAAVILGVEALIKYRFDRKTFIQLALVALTGLLLSSPYWVTVVHNHGAGIFFSPMGGQYQGTPRQSYLDRLLNDLLYLNVTYNGWTFFWDTSIFLGLLWLVLRGKFTLPLIFLALVSIPREGDWLVGIPSVILCTVAWMDLLPLINRLSGRATQLGKWALALAVILTAIYAAYTSWNLVRADILDKQEILTESQIQTLQQARDLLPADAKVIVIGNSALMEWSPYLLQRDVVNNQFGQEWQPARLDDLKILNTGLGSAQNFDQVLKLVEDHTGYDKVYLLTSARKFLSELEQNSTVSFSLKIETNDIQLGLLSKTHSQ